MSPTCARCLMPTWSPPCRGVSSYNPPIPLAHVIKKMHFAQQWKPLGRVTPALWQYHQVPWSVLPFCFQLSGCQQCPKAGTCDGRETARVPNVTRRRHKRQIYLCLFSRMKSLWQVSFCIPWSRIQSYLPREISQEENAIIMSSLIRNYPQVSRKWPLHEMVSHDRTILWQ